MLILVFLSKIYFVTQTTSIPFAKTGYFSKTICDYLEQKTFIQDFYTNFPDLKGFEIQIKSRIKFNDTLDRKTLVQTLRSQYQKLDTSLKTQENIESLLSENTFTVTTGHQLNLFTGPLYFLYKIISTINLTAQLKREFPTYNFVPVYWMATEDHDFEEIQYFNFQGNKIIWKKETEGAVGQIDTNGLQDVFDEFSKQLGNSNHAIAIKELFKKSYLEHDTLSAATHYLANELFGQQGLVILDADKKALKKSFIFHIKNELINQTCHKEVSKTIGELEKNYKIQVKPREINLFYMDKNLRERIIFENGKFKVNNTDILFSEKEILKEVDANPEKFSPNVLMRPLYQEVILPNLCYIGGGGELAYWLELKNYFNSLKVSYPILLLRNSALLITKKQGKKMQKLGISKEDIFQKQTALLKYKIKDISEINIDFSPQRKQLEKMFQDLEALANQTDRSFLGAVKAQEKKQINGFDKLEKRLLKAQKRKLSDIVERITILQNELFPNYSLQERNANFSEFYLHHGKQLNDILFRSLQPLNQQFDLIEI